MERQGSALRRVVTVVERVVLLTLVIVTFLLFFRPTRRLGGALALVWLTLAWPFAELLDRVSPKSRK